MAFTVEDLNDLLALLEKHPEWKERLRQVLLTEDLLRLPAAVNRLIASVDKLTEAVERLTHWQQQANEQLGQLLEWQRETIRWQKETNEQLRQLLEWQRETTQWQKEVNEQLRQLIEWQRETTQWQKEVNEQLRQLLEWQRETTQWQRQVNEQLRQLNEQLRQLLEWQQEMIKWQRETTQWQQQVNEQLRQLLEWQRDTTYWQQQINEQLRQINEQLRQLLEWQQEINQWRLEVTEWQRRADARFDRIERDLAKLKGAEREWYYILRAPAVFGIFVTRGRDPRNEVMEKLHDAVKKGLLTRKELKILRDADHLWLGEYDGRQVLLVIEVSYTVSHEDLVRAVRRTEIARQLGYNAVPVVAGAEVPDEIWEQARNLNVIVMSDGDTDFDFAEQVIKQAVGLSD